MPAILPLAPIPLFFRYFSCMFPFPSRFECQFPFPLIAISTELTTTIKSSKFSYSPNYLKSDLFRPVKPNGVKTRRISSQMTWARAIGLNEPGYGNKIADVDDDYYTRNIMDNNIPIHFNFWKVIRTFFIPELSIVWYSSIWMNPQDS